MSKGGPWLLCIIRQRRNHTNGFLAPKSPLLEDLPPPPLSPTASQDVSAEIEIRCIPHAGLALRASASLRRERWHSVYFVRRQIARGAFQTNDRRLTRTKDPKPLDRRLETVSLQPAVFQPEDPVAGTREAGIMCRNYRRQALFPVHLGEQAMEGFRRVLVQVAGWFVGQQQ
jgi:hypothetical protein